AFLYTLPSVADDIDMGITHVIRGEDHVANTGTQIEIFEALGGAVPTFGHFSLLVGADGSALSKRLGSLSIAQLREDGLEPLAITSHIAKLGTSDALEAGASLDDLGASFDLAKMGRAPARFDEADLARINAGVLHAMDYSAAQPRLAALGADLGEDFWLAVRPNLKRFADVADLARIVGGQVTPVIEDPAFVAQALSLLPETVDASTWGAWTTAIKDATGAKGRALFMPLRQALTGMEHGPDMAALLALIGREKAARRLAGERA
ncbi:MAG TPA: glutamate--tRNA ligase family protein, partial [Caulobacter sp.]|nr:glutamate--tRNA ligase family protein [Caulobacter sp.]